MAATGYIVWNIERGFTSCLPGQTSLPEGSRNEWAGPHGSAEREWPVTRRQARLRLDRGRSPWPEYDLYRAIHGKEATTAQRLYDKYAKLMLEFGPDAAGDFVRDLTRREDVSSLCQHNTMSSSEISAARPFVACLDGMAAAVWRARRSAATPPPPPPAAVLEQYQTFRQSSMFVEPLELISCRVTATLCFACYAPENHLWTKAEAEILDLCDREMRQEDEEAYDAASR